MARWDMALMGFRRNLPGIKGLEIAALDLDASIVSLNVALMYLAPTGESYGQGYGLFILSPATGPWDPFPPVFASACKKTIY